MSGQKKVPAAPKEGLLSLADRPSERGRPVRHVGMDGGDRLPQERRFPAVGGNPQRGFHAHWSTAGSALPVLILLILLIPASVAYAFDSHASRQLSVALSLLPVHCPP